MTNIQDNDEAFLNLLSSQRKLLCQLNMESAVRQEQQANAFQVTDQCRRGSIIGGLDPMSMMNRPIIERRGSMEFLLTARRLSLGMDGEFSGISVPPSFFSEHDDLNQKSHWDVASVASKTTKRRRSSLGLLGSILLDDQQQSRRLSLMSNFSKTYDNDVDKIVVREEIFGAEKFLPSNTGIRRNSSHQLKVQMEAFASAMSASAKSQQVGTSITHHFSF